jgi:hypothetical protein
MWLASKVRLSGHSTYFMQTKPSFFPARLSQPGSGRAGVKDALVEFFFHSKVSSKVLRLLSTRGRPVSYRRLMDEIRFGSERDELPPGALRAVLSITQAAGLVRQTRDGFSITDLGREVQERVEPRRGVVRRMNSPVRKRFLGRTPASVS